MGLVVWPRITSTTRPSEDVARAQFHDVPPGEVSTASTTSPAEISSSRRPRVSSPLAASTAAASTKGAAAARDGGRQRAGGSEQRGYHRRPEDPT